MYKCFVLFFCFFFAMKHSRLEDLWIATMCFARRGRSWATEGGCRRHLWWCSRLLPRPVVEPKVVGILGGFHSAALTFWIYNTFLNKIAFYQLLWKSMEQNFYLPATKMLYPYSLCSCRWSFQNMMYLQSIVFLPSNQACLVSRA